DILFFSNPTVVKVPYKQSLGERKDAAELCKNKGKVAQKLQKVQEKFAGTKFLHYLCKRN
ncbi:MAG: hypothetical protein II970_08665, partial [Paludibacteraceae bacterium]|nr:hypothetical protein [Paludibacteraceae bacterium]